MRLLLVADVAVVTCHGTISESIEFTTVGVYVTKAPSGARLELTWRRLLTIRVVLTTLVSRITQNGVGDFFFPRGEGSREVDRILLGDGPLADIHWHPPVTVPPRPVPPHQLGNTNQTTIINRYY